MWLANSIMDIEAVKFLYPFLVMLFGAGVTWGVMKSGQRETRSTVEDLKGEVKNLRDIGTEFRVLKSEHMTTQSQVKEHDARIGKLEMDVASLPKSRARRKR